METPPAEGSLFEYLEPAEREYLTALGEPRRFAEGETLLRQGDPSDHVLILLGGWVRVYDTSPDGQETVLALRGPGDAIGELAALHGWDRTVSVQALEAVTVAQLRSPRFLACLHERPGIAIAMIKQNSTRMREAEFALLDFATQDVSRRVARHLLRLAGQHGEAGPDGITLGLPLSQQDIANRVGASLRGVARAMSVLRERGIVLTARRRIVIARPDVLRAFAR